MDSNLLNRNNLKRIDYNTIYQSISNLKVVGLTTKLNEDSYIDRVRINYSGEITTNKKQISYPNLLNNIINKTI